jgi:hypothetical protein
MVEETMPMLESYTGVDDVNNVNTATTEATPELYTGVAEPESYNYNESEVNSADVAAVFIFGGIFLICMMFILAMLAVILVSQWKIFTKAGQEGWKAIIPIYNVYIMSKMLNRPGWFAILMFVPFANIYVVIVLLYSLSKAFGKDIGYTLGLIFLGIVFFPMLAFGDAQFRSPMSPANIPPQNPNPTPVN